VKESADSSINDNSYELWVLQGLRALLGEEKAQEAMVALQSNNPAACEQIMAEVQKRYDAFSPEDKEDPSKILAKVVASSVKLKLKMVVKAAPKGILKSIPKIPKIMFATITKILKSLFVKQ